MIRIVYGDILDAKESVIGHQVNCKCVMEAGLAKQLRDKDEKIYSNYRFWCETKPVDELLGSVQLVKVAHNKYVANIFAQYNYGRVGRYTNYTALKSGLTKLKEFSQSNNLTVALPFGLGSGLAGGEWGAIYNIIDEVFNDCEVVLYKI